MGEKEWTPVLGLRMALTRRGQSRAELAAELEERLGRRWTETMVNELIAGRKRITLEILMAISEIQRIPLEYYAYGRQKSRYADEPIPGYLDRAAASLLSGQTELEFPPETSPDQLTLDVDEVVDDLVQAA